MILLDAIKMVEQLGSGHIYPNGVPESCQNEYDRMHLIRWIVGGDGFLHESIPSDILPTRYKLVTLSILDLRRKNYIVEKDGYLHY